MYLAEGPHPGSWVTNEVGDLAQEAPTVSPGMDHQRGLHNLPAA